MKLTILGSGTCVPSLKRSSCSFVIESKNAVILFDIGAGTIRRLLEAGISINEITHIFLSHLHPDHTGELVSFLFSSKYPKFLRTGNPLTIVAGKGFLNFFNALQSVYGKWLEFDPDFLTIKEMSVTSEEQFSLHDLTIKTAPVNHTDESIAYRIEQNSRSATYSGDTAFCDSLVALAKDTDLFICESAMPDDLKLDNHLTPSGAGELARLAGAKKLILTHFYPECDKTDIAKECRRTYDGELILAEDLMTLSL